MGQIVNQINVLLQRVRMAGREPHKILMHQGIKEALRTELETGGMISKRINPVLRIEEAIYDPRQGALHDLTFNGLPIVVDNSVTEILIQVKPRPYAEEEPIPNIDWRKLRKVNRK